MRTSRLEFRYVPSATGLALHECDEPIKLVTGPFGSGKSCMVINDLLFYAYAQAPAPDGVRYTRIGVIRSSYPELASTTRKSILEVMPSDCGTIKAAGAPIEGLYRIPLPDGTIAQIEWALLALESAEDKRKLRSTNWSYAWINEAIYVNYEIFVELQGRVGRYPSEDMGGCSYAGIIMDFNQPERGNYLLDLMEHPPAGVAVFKQPPAAFKEVDEYGVVNYILNPNAENLNNLTGGTEYYRKQIDLWKADGRTDQIDSLFCMLDVPMKDGKPVFPAFDYNIHVAKNEIEPIRHTPVIIGYDTSGIHPGVVLMQETQGKWAVIDELYGDGIGLETFVEQLLIPLLRNKYPASPVIVSCDPANAKDSYTGLAPTAHLKELGFEVHTPHTNDPKTRIRAVEQLLNKNIGGIVVSPHCEMTIRAFQGGYRYKKLKISGTIETAYDAKPEKNKYSHLADALQYAALYINQGELLNFEDIRRVSHCIKRRQQILKRIM